MKLSDFSLLKEDQSSYKIGHPKGRSMLIPKKGISDKAQKLISQLKKEQGFDEGGGDIPDDGENVADSATADSSPPPSAVSDSSSGNESESVQDTPEAIQADAAETEPSDNSQPTASDPTTAAVPASQNPSQDASQMGAFPDNVGALQQEKAAIQGGLAATQQAGNQEASAYEQAAKDTAHLDTPDKIFKRYNTTDENLQKAYMNNKIDPNRYLKNQGIGSKITSGIALILGGIGGALTHQKNPALEYMNNAIDQDIDSQKNDQSKAMNLWKMNRNALGDEMQASLATKNQLLSVAKVKALSAAAAALGPQAKQNAAQAIAAIDQQINMNNWMRSRSQSGATGTEQQHVADMDTMRMVNPKLREEMEKKYIPGVGVARIEPSADQRKELITFDSLGKRIDEAKNFAMTQAGAKSNIPGTEAYAKASNLKSSLAVELNKLYGLNRLTDVEYHNFKDQIGEPGSILSSQSVTPLNDLKGQLEERKQSTYNALGITPFKKPPSDNQAVAWARANPGNPNSAKILQLNGMK